MYAFQKNSAIKKSQKIRLKKKKLSQILPNSLCGKNWCICSQNSYFFLKNSMHRGLQALSCLQKKCSDKNPNTPYLFSRVRSSRELQAKMSSFLHSPPEEGGGSGGRLPHVVNYRASMLYVTSLCILGVDFPVFPRYFLKKAEHILILN